ncbi:MAG: CoB--CoM heterodisulfide reductase iron-sulfur subunit A family protein [Clostridia bacterium]|nr:CoB--CoM heterodisulfide reductase iron-sulfur subunit A family protein [Clostridia bacterium]
MKRIGVFVCSCGSNIEGTVDVGTLVGVMKKERYVVYSANCKYMCSSSGQDLIKNAITEYKLTGIVVCACSPRMHEQTFRKAAASAGLNPYMVEIANIREQCSWVHKNREEATNKATLLCKAAVAKLICDEPLYPKSFPVTKRALVIGGGIAGIQTAEDIANAGFKVDIVEKEPSIGGKMAMLDKTFPTLDCSACILTPKTVDISHNENVRIFSYSEVESVSGYVGNFTVKIRKKARHIKEDLCTGCGLCAEKCPVKDVPDKFDQYLGKRSAVYIPFAQAIPKVAVIDPDRCRMLKEGKCGLCSKICGAKAVDYDQKDEIIEEEYGAIAVATGINPIDVTPFDEYSYKHSKDVITALQLERILNASGPTGGRFVRLSDGNRPKTVCFISCVGSRCAESDARGKTYCSKICCMYTAKQAILIKEKYPDTDIYVFYIDVRTPGKNFDEFYRRAAEKYGVKYVKGMVGKVCDENGVLTVKAADLINNEQMTVGADLVVLAAAVEPDKTAKELAAKLNAGTDGNGFFNEAHPKLRPVESPTAGVYLSGACSGPKDIPETVAQASAAAAKIIGLLSKNTLDSDPCTAHPDELKCSGCSLCANVCPYNAITYTEKEFRMPDRSVKTRRVASVNPAVCRGCGACTVACNNGAMDLYGFSRAQILAEVDSI